MGVACRCSYALSPESLRACTDDAMHIQKNMCVRSLMTLCVYRKTCACACTDDAMRIQKNMCVCACTDEHARTCVTSIIIGYLWYPHHEINLYCFNCICHLIRFILCFKITTSLSFIIELVYIYLSSLNHVNELHNISTSNRPLFMRFYII